MSMQIEGIYSIPSLYYTKHQIKKAKKRKGM